MADRNEEFKYLNLFAGTGALDALLMPGSCMAAWGSGELGGLSGATGGQGAPTCQCGLWGETTQRHRQWLGFGKAW